MIRDDSASLIVSSTTRTIAEVSGRLDLRPTRTHEMGEVNTDATGTSDGPPRFQRDSRWVFTVDDDGPGDETGFGAVRRLFVDLEKRDSAIRALRPDFDVWIQWTAFSDGPSAGFVIPTDVLASLAHLECPLKARVEFHG